MFIGADFNSRIGLLSDILHDLDTIPERTILDKSINQHGHDFLEFLNDSKFCVLNGRLNTNEDNYTSISKKGKSVVDFICVPHDNYSAIKYFKVLTVQSIVDSHSLHGLLGERSRLPDHSVLVTEFETGYRHTFKTNTTQTATSGAGRFNLKRIHSNFMESELSRLAISQIIARIERCRETQ